MRFPLRAVAMAAFLFNTACYADLAFDMPIDSPFVQRLMRRDPSKPPDGVPTNLYPGCHAMSDSDLTTIDSTTMQAILDSIRNTIADTSQQVGGRSMSGFGWVDPTNNGNMRNDYATCASNNVFGQGANGGAGDDNMVLYVPTKFEQQFYAGAWLFACLSDPNTSDGSAKPLIFDSSDCNAVSNHIAGSVSGTSASISTSIERDVTLDVQYSESSSQQFTAGVSYTISDTAQLGVQQLTNTLQIDFSYQYTSGQSRATDNTTTTAQTVQITLNPVSGQQCDLVVTENYCTATAKATAHVVFRGTLAHKITNYGRSSGLPTYRCETNTPMTCMQDRGYFAIGDLNNPTAAAYESRLRLFDLSRIVNALPNPPSVINTMTGSLTTTGNYAINCTGGDAGAPAASTYKPTLKCPANLPRVAHSCSSTIDDYLKNGVVTSDYQQWAAQGLSYSQYPAPGSEVGYGQSTVSIVVSGPSIDAVSCQMQLAVIPPYTATFDPQIETLSLPSDGSPSVLGVYQSAYVGSCDASQSGVCLISDVQARNADGFSFQTVSVSKYNPIQTLRFSTSSSAGWPANDVLSFTVTCSDSYGNSGNARYQQNAVRLGQNTQTVPGLTSTLTLKTEDLYLYTSTFTIHTSTSVPLVTTSEAVNTTFVATSYTDTTTLVNTTTLYTPHTFNKKGVTYATVTPPPKTVYKEKALHTSIKTVRKWRPTFTRTVRPPKATVTAKCDKNHKRDFGVSVNSPGTGTTTATDATSVFVVTDSSDTYTQTLSSTTVVADDSETVVVEGSTSTVVVPYQETDTLETVSTLTSVATETLPSNVTQTKLCTSTITKAAKIVTKTHTKKSTTLTTTIYQNHRTVWKTVHLPRQTITQTPSSCSKH